MEISKIVLEYLKVLLSAQVVICATTLTFFLLFKNEFKSLLNRIASIKIGGAELAAPQPLTQSEREKAIEPAEDVDLPDSINVRDPKLQEDLRNAFTAERARAHLWEYRYLNYFLVHNTQRVLDWLIGLETSPTFAMYDAWWQASISTASERRSIIQALEEHNLVVLQNEVIAVSPKGQEYAEWRGPLPNEGSSAPNK
ncbi:MAG: hypothetical protein ABW126_08020 [Candidatus Sedimenticola sp. 4PFRAG1]